MTNIWYTTEKLTPYMMQRCAKECEICGGSIPLTSTSVKYDKPKCRKEGARRKRLLREQAYE